MRTVLFASAGLALLGLTACGGAADEQTVRGPDGEEVTVSRDGDNTVTYTTEDGEATITTGSGGDTATGDLPAYPGADASGGMNFSATGEDGAGGQVSSFQTNDPPERVIAFYRDALESRGYTVTATMQTGQHQTITAERGRGAGVHITATSMGGQGTNVAVIAGQGG